MGTVHGIFDFINPPDAAALAQVTEALDDCFYPWERCLPELDAESGGLVTVRWEDTGQGNSGMYYKSWRPPGGTYSDAIHNVILLNNRYASTNWAFTMLHEAGHMVDDTALRDDQRAALLTKWHADLDGPYEGVLQNGQPHEWSHANPHTHTAFPGGWSVSMDNDTAYTGYFHKPSEAFADVFVACFAPALFPYKRFAHWSDDYATLRSIILSEPAPPPPPPSKFPNDSIYRLYRAYFLREPDQGGYDYWKGRLAAGMTLSQISGVFVGSAEFVSRYGSLNNWGFVKLVYQNVLGRDADQGGLNYWVDKLNRGMPRGDLMVHFSESAEFIQRIDAERS